MNLDLTPYSTLWSENPEPSVPTLDPQTILETEGSHDGYLWHAVECSEQWLAYDGELMDVRR